MFVCSEFFSKTAHYIFLIYHKDEKVSSLTFEQSFVKGIEVNSHFWAYLWIQLLKVSKKGYGNVYC